MKPTALVLVLTAAPLAIAQAPVPPAAVDFVKIDRLQYRDRIEADGRFERSQEVTILLRDGAAVAAFGQVGMPYVDGYGDVTFENVVIEKADGRRIEVKDAPVEDINPFGLTGYPVAADVRFKKLTIPGLEPGDRLSYRAAVKQKPLAPGRIFGEMKFPGMTSDPLQVYELDLPRDPAIAVELDKGLGAAWEEQPGPPDRVVRRLSVRPKRPDFGTEAPTEADLEALAQPDVVFSNFRSWSDVAEWWWRVARDRLVPDAAVRAEAARIAAGRKSDREKIEALHAFVATRVRYLSVSFGLGRMQPRPAGDVLSNKYGDCKDKLTLLAALATAVGLRAHIRWSFRSDGELEMRFGFRLTPQDRYAEIVQKTLAYMWKDGKVTNITTSDPSDISAPFRVEFDAEVTPPDRSAESEWALWLPLPDFGLPAARKKATGDDKAAEFAVNEYVARAEIALPEGTSARAPLSVALERPFARLTSDYAVHGSTLTASRRLMMLKRSVTGAESAAYESFRQAVDKDRQQDFWVEPSRSGAAGAVSATALHKDGLAALEKRDYPRAVAALEKAVAADPKLKNGFEALGRALRSAGRDEDALKAFTRQIELDPFHESAYAERAYTLLELKRSEEAEKDLLKQIEVAPFKSWSYERLGQIRMREKRYAESARYYASAAAIESNAENWVSLGWAHALAGKPKEALPALERARGLDPADWLAVRIASGFSLAGEVRTAGEIAEGVLPKIADRLAALTPAAYGTSDLYWTTRLFEVWQLIGAAALARGDTARAEKYLEAAWQGGFLPEAAWRLGELRQRQKRPAETASLWAAAKSIPSWWDRPDDFEQRRAALGAGDPGPDFLMKLRTVALRGAPGEDFTGEVLVLLGSDGKLEAARNLGKSGQAVFDRARPRLIAARVELPRPDERPLKVVRRGLFVCNRLTTCSVVFDLPGTEPFVRSDR